jgi:hypothetical protein
MSASCPVLPVGGIGLGVISCAQTAPLIMRYELTDLEMSCHLVKSAIPALQTAMENDPTGKSAKTCQAPLAKIFLFFRNANQAI